MKSISRIFLFLLSAFIISPVIYSQDKSQIIDELITKYYDSSQFNGSALVSENGKVILSKGYGFANVELQIPNVPDTKFRLASVTKQFTAMLVMQLVEDGKINLDGKISDYLSYYRKDTGDSISIQNLLTHTSGIPNYTNDPELTRNYLDSSIEVKALVERFCSKDILFKPGSRFNYSNSGYVILGAIIEEVTGKKYEDVLCENILVPLEMTNTGYDHTDSVIENRALGYNKNSEGFRRARFIDMSIPYSAGSMYSTVEDLFKWDQALYTEKLLSDTSKMKMFNPFFEDYGFGWFINEVMVGDLKKKLVSHSGIMFGFSNTIIRYTDDNNCIILLNNLSNTNVRALGNDIAGILYVQKYDLPK